MGFLDSLSPR